MSRKRNPHPTLLGTAAATSLLLDLTFRAALISMPEAYGQRGRRLLRSVSAAAVPERSQAHISMPHPYQQYRSPPASPPAAASRRRRGRPAFAAFAAVQPRDSMFAPAVSKARSPFRAGSEMRAPCLAGPSTAAMRSERTACA